MIERGKFRKDLYYRLRGVTIHVPPLREHREDIAELAHYFLFRFNRQLGTAVQSISPQALELLEKYDWPGNVRELQSVVREALIVSAGPTILPEFLASELHREGGAEPESEPDVGAMPDVDWGMLREFVETATARGETDIYRRALERSTAWLSRTLCRAPAGSRTAQPKSSASAALRCVRNCGTCRCPWRRY